jgi:hypothetical protein
MVISDVCPQWQSLRYKQNGHLHNGKQHHRCHDGGRQFVDCCGPYRVSDDIRAPIECLLEDVLPNRTATIRWNVVMWVKWQA